MSTTACWNASRATRYITPAACATPVRQRMPTNPNHKPGVGQPYRAGAGAFPNGSLLGTHIRIHTSDLPRMTRGRRCASAEERSERGFVEPDHLEAHPFQNLLGFALMLLHREPPVILDDMLAIVTIGSCAFPTGHGVLW